jgi:DNA-binding NarL/FixJ family response regulator
MSNNTSPAGLRTVRVLIIDSHPIVREGLRRIIEKEEGFSVCAEADTSSDARSLARETGPDVIIADLSLKQGSGIDLVRCVRANHPSMPILVLSTYDEAIYAERMLAVGANGYLTKFATPEQILLALRRVLDGGIYVSDAVSDNMIRRLSGNGHRLPPNPFERLSVRELQVLQLVGEGVSTREAANVLNLSVKTIESHRQRIKSKLNLRTGTQLVQFAINRFIGEHAGTTANA